MKIKLTILGTGTFLINKDRSASAYLLEADNKKILIDCGPGTLMRLSQAGVKPQDLDYILISHFHADHTSDLFPLFMNYRLADFSSENNLLNFPKIIGPKNIKNFLINFSKGYELPAMQGWGKIDFVNVTKEQKLGNIKMESFRVKHVAFGVNANSYAFRFTIGGKVIAFSGDSTRCPGVEKACQKADLFICDASYSKGKNNQAHMDTNDIGSLCQKNQVKKVILSHLYPQTDKIDLVAEVKEKFLGEVVRGKDFMTMLI
jgi:ribonuclease BN (tRNA processing enzyme)